MAINHLDITTYKGENYSVMGTIAYTHGITTRNPVNDRIYNHSYRQDVYRSTTILPLGSPEWAQDYQQLWKAVALADTRKNRRKSRGIVLALPHELPLFQNWNLLNGFVEQLTNDYKIPAAVAMHVPDLVHVDYKKKKKRKRSKNIHGHVTLSTRFLTDNGMGKKATDWDLPATSSKIVTALRQLWEVSVNRALEDFGLTCRISCKKLKDLGNNRDTRIHVGPRRARIIESCRKTGEPIPKSIQKILDHNARIDREILEDKKKQAEKEIFATNDPESILNYIDGKIRQTPLPEGKLPLFRRWSGILDSSTHPELKNLQSRISKIADLIDRVGPDNLCPKAYVGFSAMERALPLEIQEMVPVFNFTSTEKAEKEILAPSSKSDSALPYIATKQITECKPAPMNRKFNDSGVQVISNPSKITLLKKRTKETENVFHQAMKSLLYGLDKCREYIGILALKMKSKPRKIPKPAPSPSPTPTEAPKSPTRPQIDFSNQIPWEKKTKTLTPQERLRKERQERARRKKVSTNRSNPSRFSTINPKSNPVHSAPQRMKEKPKEIVMGM